MKIEDERDNKNYTEEELKEILGDDYVEPHKAFCRQSYDASVEVPPCQSLSAVRQYMGIDETVPDETFDKILKQIETSMSCERGGDISYHNDTLVAQATLFDLALRYYYGGGETRKVNDKDFCLALKACDASLRVIQESRKARRNETLDTMKAEELFLKQNIEERRSDKNSRR